jgi:flagellar basal-body rod protein FlgG
MDMSFWAGAAGASASQRRLDVTSNNLANINNHGFKPKDARFRELVNYKLNDKREAVTNLMSDAGARVVQTSTNFRASGITTTDQPLDYAILDDNAFFMLKDPATGEISYTRDGHFHLGEAEDGSSYLTTESGKYVLDAAQQPIRSEFKDGNDKTFTPAAFTLPHPSRMLSQGDNEYYVEAGDTKNAAVLKKDARISSGVLETSGTDMAREMTKIIESQRAFSYALRMVQTSDEIEGTVNSLRS